MKTSHYPLFILTVSVALAIAGCATADKSSNEVSGGFPVRFRTDDGRNIVIGASRSDNGGWLFDNPHMNECWVADGFQFTNFNALYIAPTESTAKYEQDEARLHEWVRTALPEELARRIQSKSLFTVVSTNSADVQPEARVLRMENTIVEYTKGGGAARYWAGLYGAGQPALRVQGQLKDGEKVVFRYDVRRSGVSGTGRVFGGFMRDESIQTGDIESMATDLADFIAALSGKYVSR